MLRILLLLLTVCVCGKVAILFQFEDKLAFRIVHSFTYTYIIYLIRRRRLKKLLSHRGILYFSPSLDKTKENKRMVKQKNERTSNSKSMVELALMTTTTTATNEITRGKKHVVISDNFWYDS